MTSNEFGDYLSLNFVDKENFESSLKVEELPNNCQAKRILPFADSLLYHVAITNTRVLTKGEDVKRVYDLTFDVKDIDRNFEPGDTIGILPHNDEDEVEQILSRLKLESVATKPYKICILKDTSKKKPVIPAHIPIAGTIRELLTNCLDIRSIPKKMFLRSLARYTTQHEEKEKLELLSSPKNSSDYINFVTTHTTLLKLLEAFPSCYPPIERLLENLPPLQPRPYSISSSPLVKSKKNVLRITFSVISIDEDTKGVCSGWLEKVIEKLEMVPKQKFDGCETENNTRANSEYCKNIQFYFRRVNNFRLPVDPSIPIIMIGPGTGVAPFIGFLQHRQLQIEESNMRFGTSWLFFGCRYSDRDFLYKGEIEEFLSKGTLTKLFTCFSRENTKKTYVQDMIKNHGKDFVDKIICENASIYVCGDAKNMAKDIKSAIISCIEMHQGLSNADATMFVKDLEQTNRYIQDAWL